MRSNQALAILKTYARLVSKSAEPLDANFAKGVTSTLRWLMDEASPPPFADVLEDLGDDGGWIAEEEKSPLPKLVEPIPVPVPEYRPNVELWTPDSPMPTEADNPKAVAPGSFEAQARNKPWLGQIAVDLAGIQDGTPLSDRNAVVVGAGLGDEPLLRGGYDG